MQPDELKPIVYTLWGDTLDMYEWLIGRSIAFYQPGTEPNGTYLNKTVVDDIFLWGEKYRTSPPVFAKLPLHDNIILNNTGHYGRKAVYLLGASTDTRYTLCSVKVFQSPLCSTQYKASTGGDSIESICPPSGREEPNPDDDWQYIKQLSPDQQKSWNSDLTISKDWPATAGSSWANGLMLDGGLFDSNNSLSWALTQLMLKSAKLPLDRPSFAEAIAVLASGSLLMASQGMGFRPDWNSSTSFPEGQMQYFNSTILAQEYTSGGADNPVARGFYAVLFVAFLLNILCLVYFVYQNGLVTDFSEPLNLFALAINSPPSAVMAGSSATGPSSKQAREKWFIDSSGAHLVLESHRDQDDSEESVETEP